MTTNSILVGVDDTDNLSSRGTGYRARRLTGLLHEAGLATVDGVSRHQLLVSPLVPYTSHNSAACLRLTRLHEPLEAVIAFCRDYLVRESAEGADAGLCVARSDAVEAEVQAFGARAQQEVLTQAQALDVAARAGIHLEGLTGTRDGLIGALAAVGLRQQGHGGRFIWVAGLRERAGESLSVAELGTCTGVHAVRSQRGETPAGGDRVDLGPWPRPVLMDGEAILLVEKTNEHDRDHECWRVIPKAAIKRY